MSSSGDGTPGPAREAAAEKEIHTQIEDGVLYVTVCSCGNPCPLHGHAGDSGGPREAATEVTKEALWVASRVGTLAEFEAAFEAHVSALRAEMGRAGTEPRRDVRRIYVAASWRTPAQPAVVERLRLEGWEVYDFRHPAPGNEGFAWWEIDPDWQQWSAAEYSVAMKHPVAEAGFACDMDALRAADTVVLLQPSGRSAALEIGWACGAGKRTAVLLADGQEPELMLKMADHMALSLDDLVGYLRAHTLLRARADAERPNSAAEHLDADGVTTDPWQSGPCGTGYLVWQEYPTASEARRVAARLNAAERSPQETTDVE